MSAPAKPAFKLDFERLKQTFIAICPDFEEEPSFEVATISRRFAQDVIFTYSKEAKTAKAKNKDVGWSMRLNVANAKGVNLRNEVYIQTHFVREPPQHQPFVIRDRLLLSFKQASLLAVEKYCQLVLHHVKRGEVILTPLAGAIFSIEDMPKLAEALPEPLADVVMAVISSCQTDGYYLQHSRCHIALLALIKTVRDLKMRASLVKKTIKMYQLHGKELQMEQFQRWSTFLKDSTPNKQRCNSHNEDYDKLTELVLNFSFPTKEPKNQEPKSQKNQKTPLKCAANFQKSKQ
ncbi:hypothetical protein KR067_004538 [Drosophila pandora]|nr:hypothetical protein KR067_004538 [Drosophila pandora]